MRIILINPPSPGIYQELGFLLPPLGLASIAATLRQAGHEIAIWDQVVQLEPPAALTDFELAGISCDTGKYENGIAWANRLHSLGLTVVMGGVHPTFRAEEVLSTGFVDAIVLGEGDITTPELVAALASDANLAEVPGVSYRVNGAVVTTPPRATVENLDDLPLPARDLLDVARYRKLELGGRSITSIITSRGCPFHCSFCSSSAFWGKGWRWHSPTRVIQEVELVVREYGFGAVAFLDDGFAIEPERVIAICEGIIKAKLDIYWWCFARLDALLNRPDMVAAMARSGCRYVFIGFEAGDVQTLSSYGKARQSGRERAVVALLKRYGIKVLASFIIGHPHDTPASVKATADFAKSLSPGAVQFSMLTPFPGTDLWTALAPRLYERRWSRFDCLHPTFTLDSLTPHELTRLLPWCYRHFYMTPGRILTGLMSGLLGGGVKVHAIWGTLKNLGRDRDED